MAVRITSINVYRVDLPVVNSPYTYSGGALHAVDSTVVEMIGDSGLVGYGECCPVGPTYQPEHALGARAALAEMLPHLLGMDPLNRRTIHTNMDNHLCGHHYAKAAVDIACWDMLGKHTGTRVCDLLGGALSERVPTYYAIGLLPPADAVEVALEKKRQGFARLQLKVGGRSIEEDIAVIRQVREAVGDAVRLAADANRTWTTRDTLFASSALAGVSVVFEQPCDSLDEIAGIRGQLQHPVYLDESAVDLSTIVSAAGKGLCDGFGFKLTRQGGIGSLAAARDVCQARHLPHSCDDAWGGDIIAAACVHVGATVYPELNEGVWIAAPYIAEHYDPVNGIAIQRGMIQVPRGPGLGITPAPERLGEPVAVYD